MKKFLAVLLCFMLVFMVSTVCCVSADTAPIISVANTTVMQGDVAKVDISIENNPGIMSMTFCIIYNTDAFEYIGYEEGFLTDYSFLNHADEGELSFINIEDTDVSQDGVMFSVLFEMKDNVEVGEYDIEIANIDPEKNGASLNDCFSNSKEHIIIPIANNGSIKVIDIIFGDVNNDGEINTRDYALLIQYINGWNVTINIDAADVNGDAEINTRDYALLIQYINGWNVTLGKK